MALAKRIATVSVPAAELDHVQQLLDRARSRLPRPWIWSSEGEADVLLIDVDSVYGHMDWLRAHGAGRRVISLTSNSAAEHDLLLLRPATLDGLVAALRGYEVSPQPAPIMGEPPIEDALKPEPIMARVQPITVQVPAVTAAAIAAVPAPTSNVVRLPEPPNDQSPSRTLAEWCVPGALGRVMRLQRGELPALTIDVDNDCYYGPNVIKPLAGYCEGSIRREEWEMVSAPVLAGLREAGGSQPLGRLLWLYALVSSNGQLLAGLEVNGRYRLTRWPQAEREFPKHFRIATVMMRGTASLSEISEQSTATLADVIDFVNAYTVTGAVEMEGASLPVAAEAGASGLLARLRGRVRRA
jgi:hypothetical protein